MNSQTTIRIGFGRRAMVSLVGAVIGVGLWALPRWGNQPSTAPQAQASLGMMSVEFGKVPASQQETATQQPALDVASTTESGISGRTGIQDLSLAAETSPALVSPAVDWARELLGTWEFKDSVERVIENRPGGEATMHVKLDFLSALRYGPQMQLDLQWEVSEEQDRTLLTHRIVSGTPEKSVKTVIQDWGIERQYEILSMGDGKLLLKTVKYGTEETWVRVSQADFAVEVRTPAEQ